MHAKWAQTQKHGNQAHSHHRARAWHPAMNGEAESVPPGAGMTNTSSFHPFTHSNTREELPRCHRASLPIRATTL